MDTEDPLTRLNTQLNRSMVLMETATETVSEPRSKKTIRINTNTHPPEKHNTSHGLKRKSILKKSTPSRNHEFNSHENLPMDIDVGEEGITTSEIIPRPSNVNKCLFYF